MIASVNPCQLVAPELVTCSVPVTPRVDRREDPGREVGGERRRQPLVGHDLERALLAGASDHPRDEVPALRRAAVQAVQAGRADDERARRVRQRGMLAGELRDRVDAARVRQRRPRRTARSAVPSNT